jgi:hypothetical protein
MRKKKQIVRVFVGYVQNDKTVLFPANGIPGEKYCICIDGSRVFYHYEDRDELTTGFTARVVQSRLKSGVWGTFKADPLARPAEYRGKVQSSSTTSYGGCP